MPFRSIIILTFVFNWLCGTTQAQIVNKQYLAVQGGAIDFSSKWLNNPTPHNKRMSAFSQIEYGYPISKYLTPYTQIALGHIKNMGPDFQAEFGSDFERIGFGMILNPNNGKFFLSEKPKMVEPYGLIGYNIDIINQNHRAGFNSMISSVCFGVGCWIPIADKLNIGYRYTWNQKLGQDYRTFNQHTLGFLIQLED
ncbi:MAG: hypothetical protein M0R38_05305 [Bacteroidia bacterium]|nr:hypothetical protein [Bacteroidia bacterium]